MLTWFHPSPTCYHSIKVYNPYSPCRTSAKELSSKMGKFRSVRQQNSSNNRTATNQLFRTLNGAVNILWWSVRFQKKDIDAFRNGQNFTYIFLFFLTSKKEYFFFNSFSILLTLKLTNSISLSLQLLNLSIQWGWCRPLGNPECATGICEKLQNYWQSGGSRISRAKWGINLSFCNIFLKTVWKWRRLDMGCVQNFTM